MNIIHYFFEQPAKSEIPASCRNPFDNNPYPLAISASENLQQWLIESPLISDQLFQKENGKMFGVLVIEDEVGKIGYLAGFSGMLNKQWEVPGFVPPVFDIKKQQSFLLEGERQVSQLTEKIDQLLTSPLRQQAKTKLKALEKQREILLEKLKSRHKENKQKRNQDRQNNKESLEKLSYLSQQDKRDFKAEKSNWEELINKAEINIQNNFEIEIIELIKKRKQLSQQLHKKVFENYLLVNKLDESESLINFFDGKIPPGGAGDCAAPKLIQYAHLNKLKILAMAEFWWGASPAKGVRHHAHFYPPCRGKCHPILPFMLQGVCVEQSAVVEDSQPLLPEIVYEDENLVVVNKPAGLLSIPGKQIKYSVLSWLQQRYPQATGPLLVHRLDMATSGLLLAAKDSQTHKQLQKQFINRSVKKRYVAVLSKKLEKQNETVNLPLRVDLDDRPRQVVCYEHGKKAVTHVKVISTDEDSSRVYFYPVTGRTHQLRVHAAHQLGLAAPIVGDELYGSRSERLLLHAEKLGFEHPLTGEKIEIIAKAPF